MKRLRRLAFVMAVCSIIFAISAAASQSVRIVTDLGEEKAAIRLTPNGLSQATLNLQIPVVAMTDIQLGNQTYKELKLPEGEHLFAGQTAEDGNPDLPILTSYYGLPSTGGISLTVSYSGYETIENIDIAPTQPSELESGQQSPVSFAKNEEVYARDEFYPGRLAEAGQPAIMRDVRMAQIALYPIQYNPARKELRIYHDLSIEITPSNDGSNPRENQRPYLSEAFHSIYQSLLVNFDNLYSTAEVHRGGYLIIVKPQYADSLNELALWKHRKGYAVHVARTSEIDVDSVVTKDQVFNYIRTAYRTWETPPEYVMIVGDNDNTGRTGAGIPDWSYSGYTSDHHYACVDGTDFLPDLALSRLSIDNVSDLRKAVAKIMTYETQPNMTDRDYWLRGLSVAGNVGSTTPRITVLWVRQLLFDNGFTHVDTSFRWSSGDVDPYLDDYFNLGVSLVSYRGWAGPSGWYSPSFDVGQLNALQNRNMIGVMASIVCGTGDFGSSYADPCFGETWIRMGASPTSFKGGPAFFGTTDPSTHTRWNNPIMVGYYWSIFKEGNNHFAAAAVRGKMQQYYTFPRDIDPGETVEKYFHTYNMLGDPELEVRTKIPVPIMVSHPSSLPLGVNHLEIAVTDSFNAPISDAFVTLTKGYGDNEEVFEIGQTDQSGNISLSFHTETADTMFVTVSGRDLFPYRGYVLLAQGELAVGYDSLTIDDDNVGFSQGNNDGIINPGETIELGLILKNYGNIRNANNVQATLEPIDDELVTVLDPRRAYGDIAPGQFGYTDRPFVVSIARTAVDGDQARVKLSVTDASQDSWYSVVELPVVSPRFIISQVTFPGGNSRLDPGDTANIVISLINVGNEDAQMASATLSTMDDYTEILSSFALYGNISIGDTVSNSAGALVIHSSPATFDGRTVSMALNISAANGGVSTVPFTIPVGQILASDPIGPDAYGYYMYDNTDVVYPSAPTYAWRELFGGPGERLTYTNMDDQSVLVELPFDFIYYGETYRSLIVCTNGFVSPDTHRFDMAGNFWYNFFNWPIPDPGSAQGQISPFWDDLRYSGSSYGVYKYYDDTTHQFIIEWYHMTNTNSNSTETFQMIISDPAYHPTMTGDSQILFQYNAIINNDSGEGYASVGFESYDEYRGLEYTFDNAYAPGAANLANNRAILITTNTGRGGIRGVVENAGGGDQISGALIKAASGQWRISDGDGQYWIKDIPADTISVVATLAGYLPDVMDSVAVDANQTATEINFRLELCPIPANFLASENLGNTIELTWDSLAYDEMTGYNVYRSRFEAGGYEKLNTQPITVNHFTDSSVQDSSSYWYYVTTAYTSGDWSGESFASTKDSGSLYGVVGIDGDEVRVPISFYLAQNYPNPFNPTTTISYGLPQAARVRIDIYNIMGQKVIGLVDEQQTAGYKQIAWDGRDAQGHGVASGVYFYRLDAGNFTQSMKMLLVK